MDDVTITGSPNLHHLHNEAITSEQEALLPPPVASRATAMAPTPPKRLLSFSSGVALVLGIQIGSGIFASPSLVARNADSILGALLIWAAAGLVTWACAACYADMATRMPVNGGPQEYVAYCFGDRCGFVVSWGCVFAVKPCSTAILALFVAEYVCDALGSVTGSLELEKKVAALVIIAAVSAVNCTGNRLSDASTKFLLACKMAGVGFVIFAGFAALVYPPLRSDAQPVPLKHAPLTLPRTGSYTDAVVAAMYAYSGWETVSFIATSLERKQPLMYIAACLCRR